MARRKYSGTSDLMAKARLKDENDNLSASIDEINIIHRTRERKFQFTYNKLHEVLNKLEEKGAVCELVSSLLSRTRYQITTVQLMTQNGIQYAPEDKTFVIMQAPQKCVRPATFFVIFTENESSFQLCQKPNSFAAFAENLCL